MVVSILAPKMTWSRSTRFLGGLVAWNRVGETCADYLAARLREDPAATGNVVLRLQQVQSYATSWHNPMNWIPFIGIATSVADGFQQVPLTMQVEVRAAISRGAGEPATCDAFVRRTQSFMGWGGTMSKMAGIFREHLNNTRQEVLQRLDEQLLPLWRHGHWVGEDGDHMTAATLASAIAKLDAAMADEKITKEEHDRLLQELRVRFSTRSAPTASM